MIGRREFNGATMGATLVGAGVGVRRESADALILNNDGLATS